MSTQHLNKLRSISHKTDELTVWQTFEIQSFFFLVQKLVRSDINTTILYDSYIFLHRITKPFLSLFSYDVFLLL